ncbi:DNA primase, partial [bacterium]|nr:DNA primase [bacterium]
KKRGVNYLAICPFHQDSDPSLTINDQKNIFKCFACNESGNSVTFVQKYKNCSFIDAILEIAKLFNFDEELIKSYDGKVANEQANNKIYLINELYLELCKNFLFNKKNSTVLNYLQQRGITKEIIDYFGIGYNPECNTLYDLMTNNDSNYLISDNNCYTRQDLLDANLISINKNGFVQDVFGNRIVFSIKNSDGQIAGFSGRVIGDINSPKYLNTIENKIFHKSKLLYN